MDFPELHLDDTEEEAGITFFQEDVAFELPDEGRIVRWLFAVAEAEQKPVGVLNYIFCSDEYLRKVNVEYLQHDYYTDIITFPYGTDRIHGDLFISTERVADNAVAHGQPLERELLRVMVHGVLHLAGYGDKTPAQQAQMRVKEEAALRLYDTMGGAG
jgi:rRNA maturation RNase YbeY